jgi:hypothetical protein
MAPPGSNGDTAPRGVHEKEGSRYATGVALADLTGNGMLDLVIASGNEFEEEPVEVFYNRGGSEPFAATPDWVSGDRARHMGVCLGDLNGNGRLDLVVAVSTDAEHGRASGHVKAYLNTGSEFENEPSFRTEERYEALDVDLGDLTGNGRLDLIVPSVRDHPTGAGRARAYFNQGGGLSSQADWTAAVATPSGSALAADIDGSGRLAVVVFGGRVYIYPGGSGEQGPIATEPSWQSEDEWVFSFAGSVAHVAADEVLLAVSAWETREGRSRLRAYRPGSSTAPVWSFGDLEFASSQALIDHGDGSGPGLLVGAWDADAQHGELLSFAGSQGGLASEPTVRTSANGVPEQLGIGALGQPPAEETLTLTRERAGGSVVTLPHTGTKHVDAVSVNGASLEVGEFAWAPHSPYVSVGRELAAGDTVEVSLRSWPTADLFVANWTPDQPNQIWPLPSFS